MDGQKIKAYFDHFLPREIIGPVIIVFSLEGVISGIFAMYVPQAFETVAWLIIFLLSVVLIAHWGTTGEFDPVNFIMRNKLKATGGSAATLFLALFGFYRLKLNRIENNLENLKTERTSINDEIKELQKEAFKTDEISLKEYENKLSSHKDRLMEISEKQVALVSKKSAWENFRNKKSRLKQEEGRSEAESG